MRSVESVIPGVQGRVLAVLARTETELTMRTVAQLAGVSPNRATAVLNHLVQLGLVERREAGSAALVRLVRQNEAARAVLALADLHDGVLTRLRAEARMIRPEPACLLAFGSFARGEAREESDVDVLAVRPENVSGEDELWTASLGQWSDCATEIVGNPVNVLDVSAQELPELVRRGAGAWKVIADGGVVLIGTMPAEIGRAA